MPTALFVAALLVGAPPFTLDCPTLPNVPTATGVTANVKDFGAKGDGTTDDTAAVNAALRSLPAAGGFVRFPTGTYGLSGAGIVLSKSKVTFVGSGSGVSILKRLTAGCAIQSSASYPGLTNVTVEDLGFSWGSQFTGTFSPAIVFYGAHINGVRISRCRFWRIGTFGVGLAGIKDAIIEDSVFESAGEALGGGIQTSGAASSIVIKSNRFRFLKNGVTVGPGVGDQQPSCFYVTGNYFDLGWWLLKSPWTGEGPSVKYSKTLTGSTAQEYPKAADTLTDTAANFPTFPTTGRTDVTNNIRVMPLRQSGNSGSTYSATTLDDPHGKFAQKGVRRGDIIRLDTVFAMVDTVASDRQLVVEEWLRLDDRQLAPPPPKNSAYKVYGVYIGAIWNFIPPRPEAAPTATKIVSPTGFWDLDGKRITPADGTRYEVITERPNYPLHVNPGLHDFVVSGNTFKRGWSDQISIYALPEATAVPTHAIVTNNTIEDGEDTGITLHGTQNYVQGNRIKHQGAAGLYVPGAGDTIEGNTIEDSQWCNDTLVSCGDLILDGARDNLITGNSCIRKTAIDRAGILVWSRTKDRPTSGNTLRGNTVSNHRVAASGGGDIVFYDQGIVSGNVLDGNSGTVLFFGQSVIPTNAVDGNAVK